MENANATTVEPVGNVLEDTTNYLKEAVDEIITNYKELEQAKDTEEQLDIVFSMYANMLNLEKEFTNIRKDLRRYYKVKDADVKAWMKEQDDGEEKEQQ